MTKESTSEERPYKGWHDTDLLDELEQQKIIVNDLIKFAQIQSYSKGWGSIESHSGLYFAFFRYEQLQDEILLRYDEKSKLLNNVNQN